MHSLSRFPLFAGPTVRALAAVSAFALAAPTDMLFAQWQPTRPLTGHVSGSIQLQGSSPRGDFGQNTDNGFGINGSLLVHIDPQSVFSWRTDLSFVTYGNSSRQVPLSGTGGLVQLRLRTSNNIFSAMTGPQLQLPTGVITPYAAALGGVSVFFTESSVEGSQTGDTPFASTTNNRDGSLVYGGAAGTFVRVYNGTRPVRLDLGARFLRHDDVRYLNGQRVRDAFEQNRDPIPLRGRADFVTYYFGVNAILF